MFEQFLQQKIMVRETNRMIVSSLEPSEIVGKLLGIPQSHREC